MLNSHSLTTGAPLQVSTEQAASNFRNQLTPTEIRGQYQRLMNKTSKMEFSSVRVSLQAEVARDAISPGQLLDVLSEIPAIRFLLDRDCRIPEAYTIREHHSCWLAALERHLSSSPLPIPLSKAELRVMGALHDIGKPLPNNKSDQSSYTAKVVGDIREALPFDNRALQIMLSILGNDPLGKFVVSNFERQATMEQRVEIAQIANERLLTIEDLRAFSNVVKLREPNSETQKQATAIANEMCARALTLNIAPLELFNVHLISYLADVGSYTYDAIAFNGKRSKPGIEFVFALNPGFQVGLDNDLFLGDQSTGMPKLSPAVQVLFDLIREQVPA